MNKDNSIDIIGAGKLAKAIPEKSWNRLVKTACETFDKVLAPITETTGGVGRLIKAKFDRLVDSEKVLAAETFQRATEKAKNAQKGIGSSNNVNIILRVIEESSKQTDKNIRELWANLLAQELTEGNMHPEVVNILSRLSSEDARTLAKIAECDTKSELEGLVLNSFAVSISLLGIGASMTSKPSLTFSEKLLETLNLIESNNGRWVLTAIGKGFIESVADPSQFEMKE